MKKIYISRACENSDMINYAYREITERTPSGACCLRGVNASWNGLEFTEMTFFAIATEVKKIKSQIEALCHVSISLPN